MEQVNTTPNPRAWRSRREDSGAPTAYPQGTESAGRSSFPLVQATGLTQVYYNGGHPLTVLMDVDLKIRQGEMVAIMGPSGSGKSTLLYILGLLLRPTRGVYYLAGKDVLNMERAELAACRRQVGFVFQTCDLLENYLVYENLEYPLVYAGVDPQERPDRIAAALRQVNMEHRTYHRTNRLSGGERQRVAVARALVNRPRLVLADEPTGQLDRANSEILMGHFAAIAEGGEHAVVVVTHDPTVAACCSRALTLTDGTFQRA